MDEDEMRMRRAEERPDLTDLGGHDLAPLPPDVMDIIEQVARGAMEDDSWMLQQTATRALRERGIDIRDEKEKLEEELQKVVSREMRLRATLEGVRRDFERIQQVNQQYGEQINKLREGYRNLKALQKRIGVDGLDNQNLERVRALVAAANMDVEVVLVIHTPAGPMSYEEYLATPNYDVVTARGQAVHYTGDQLPLPEGGDADAATSKD